MALSAIAINCTLNAAVAELRKEIGIAVQGCREYSRQEVASLSSRINDLSASLPPIRQSIQELKFALKPALQAKRPRPAKRKAVKRGR